MCTIYSTPGMGTTMTGSLDDQFSTLCIRQFSFSPAVVCMGMKISPNTSFVGAPGHLTAKTGKMRCTSGGLWEKDLTFPLQYLPSISQLCPKRARVRQKALSLFGHEVLISAKNTTLQILFFQLVLWEPLPMGSPECHSLVQAPKDVHRNRVGLTMVFFYYYFKVCEVVQGRTLLPLLHDRRRQQLK